MPLQSHLKNVRYFFQGLAQFYRTWFLPYHSDDEEENQTSTRSKAESASDRHPKPSPPPEEVASSTSESAQTASAVEATTTSESETESEREIKHAMAFRGAVTGSALAAVLRKEPEAIWDDLERLVQCGAAERTDQDRYVLVGSERRQILRSDSHMADWLAPLKSAQLEDELLDALDGLFRVLALKTVVRRSLILHIRQRPWAVLHSQNECCRVRILMRPAAEQWEKIRRLDEQAKRSRRRRPEERSKAPGFVLFSWRRGTDAQSARSLLVELGREFQRHVHRRPRRRHPSAPASSAGDTGPHD